MQSGVGPKEKGNSLCLKKAIIRRFPTETFEHGLKTELYPKGSCRTILRGVARAGQGDGAQYGVKIELLVWL